MNRRALALLAILGLAASTRIEAQTPGGFRVERPIVTSSAGRHRLAMDVPLLVGAAEGVTDLRLFDPSNREVPFLFVRPAPAAATWQRGALLAIAPVENATRKTSGFEVDLGEALRIDRVRVLGLPPGFLKRVVLEGSGDRSHWTLLAGEGTVFDLPDERLRQLELPFRAGMYRYLRATWDDSSSGRLPMPAAVEARRVMPNAPPAPLGVPVAFERRPSEPGRSRYLVRLPGPRLPIVALVLDVAADRVLRDAEVTESRLSGGEAAPVALGRATLRRASVGAVAASDLRIPISAPHEPVVDLTIEDNDNPPLALSGIVAEFEELPWIYFESDGGVVARYGGTNRRMPLYDLEAVRGSLTSRRPVGGSRTWSRRLRRPRRRLCRSKARPSTRPSSVTFVIFRQATPASSLCRSMPRFFPKAATRAKLLPMSASSTRVDDRCRTSWSAATNRSRSRSRSSRPRRIRWIRRADAGRCIGSGCLMRTFPPRGSC
jgi:hypothetical protein